MNMEKPRMLEESSTIPSRCRMGKSWDKKKGEARARHHCADTMGGNAGAAGGTHHGGEDVLVKR